MLPAGLSGTCLAGTCLAGTALAVATWRTAGMARVAALPGVAAVPGSSPVLPFGALAGTIVIDAALRHPGLSAAVVGRADTTRT
jgi:hypothetical protein